MPALSSENAKNEKNVAFFIVDEKYFPIAYALARRIRHLSDETLDVYVFYESTVTRIDVPSHPGITIVENALMSRLPDYIPQSRSNKSIVWARLIAPQFLIRHGYERALHLDADIAIADDLRPVYSYLPCAGVMAAIADPTTFRKNFPGTELSVKQHFRNIGLRSDRYFNAGVMLINLREWLETDFASMLAPYYKAYNKHLRFGEQDFLNYVFQDNWEELSPRWNFGSTLVGLGIEHVVRPSIVHYYGLHKPWIYPSELAPDHFQYFVDALHYAGFKPNDVFSVFPHRRKEVTRLIKGRLRHQLFRRGYRTPKVSRALRQWQENRGEILGRLRDALVNDSIIDMSKAEASKLAEQLDIALLTPPEFRSSNTVGVKENWEL